MLNDAEIIEYVKSGKIISDNYSEDSITPNGYDLRIGDYSVNTVQSNSLFFISSMERLDLPDNIVGSLHIKSRYARRGIFSSLGFVDAGFKGQLTMAFYNFGNELQINLGMKFVQLVLYEIKLPERNYSMRSGNYQNSNGINLK
ncbi:dCTP deaminase [Ferroplasma sp.]|uniref:dCTP deaminase domain-containing protein n=1 Tax=Ferroplasma sp. TaxID=2591003 RepID=UPI00307F122C